MVLFHSCRRLTLLVALVLPFAGCNLAPKDPMGLRDASSFMASSRRPTPVAEIIELANQRASEGRTIEAAAIFRSGLREHPDSPALREGLARMLDRMDRVDEAIDQFGEALRLSPDNEQYQANLAHLLYRRERYVEASVHFKQVLRINPANASVLRWCAMSLIKQDKWEEALGYAEREAVLKPDDIETRQTLVTLRESVVQRRAAMNQTLKTPASTPDLIPPPPPPLPSVVVE